MDAYGRVELGSRGRVLLAVPAVLIAAMVAVGWLANGRGGPNDRDAIPSASGQIARISPPPSPTAPPCPGDDTSRVWSSVQRIDGLRRFTITLALDGAWCRVREPFGSSEAGPSVWAAYRDNGDGRVVEKIGFAAASPLTSGIAMTLSHPCVDTPAPSPGTGVGFDRNEIEIDGISGERIEFGPASTCDLTDVLDALGDPGRRGVISYLTLWLFDIHDTRLAAYAVASDLAGDDSARRLMESIRIDVFDEPPEPFPDGPVFPPAGELAARNAFWASVDSHPSRDDCCPVGFAFWFSIASAGWTSSGPASDGHAGSLSTGTLGSADGAVLRFSNPDRVYADPCRQQPGPAVGDSVDDLVAAMAAIPGVTVEGPTSTRLLQNAFRPVRSIASQLVLTLPDELGCEPGEFALWHDDDTGPRFAAARGSTITMWIFNPDNRLVFGRVVIEVETFPGASPDLFRDIERIVSSINHLG